MDSGYFDKRQSTVEKQQLSTMPHHSRQSSTTLDNSPLLSTIPHHSHPHRSPVISLNCFQQTHSHSIHICTNQIPRILLQIGLDDSCFLQNPLHNVCIDLATAKIAQGCDLLHNGALVVDEQSRQISSPRSPKSPTCPDSL